LFSFSILLLLRVFSYFITSALSSCGTSTLSRKAIISASTLGIIFEYGANDGKQNLVPFSQPSRAKQKTGRPRLGWEDVIKKDLRKMGTSWDILKREALNKLEWRRKVRSCVGLRWLGAAVLLVVVVVLDGKQILDP
jgi:hypothetical protein